MKMLLLALALLAGGPAYAKTYYISKNTGGDIYVFGQVWAALRKDYVVVNGHCYSSCTMVLGNYPNVCVTKGATLGFHRAYIWTLGGYVTSYEGTDYMWRHYPADIQKLLNKHGGLLANRGGWFIPKMLMLRGSALPARYICK